MQEIQDLIVLGLLKESPKHGYELKQIVDERMQQIAKITSGTVYYTLRRLEKQNFVSKKRQKSGKRPERNIYQITKKGKEKFFGLLHKSFFYEDRPYFVFNAGLYFMKYVDSNVVLEGIDKKLENLKNYREIISDLEKKYPQKWPFYFSAIKTQGILLINALEKWYKKLSNEIKNHQKVKGR
jgi:DNA-binding PadR family transcriptional regulator